MAHTFINNLIHFFVKYYLAMLGLTIMDSDLEWLIKVFISGFIALAFTVISFEYKKWRNKDSKNKTE